jgi:asparagine synthase (glutamine-hydrolysing)
MAALAGICRFDDRPAAAAPSVRVAFDGRLDNRDDLIDACRERRRISTASSDAELAAAGYDVFGLDFARHLLGDFAVAVIDARARRVVLARDAMGIRPLYYRRTPTSLVFASDIKTLLADPDFEARPNNQLLAELLLRRTHRRPSDGSTLFAGVSQVPPAHVAIFTATDERIHRYWDFDRCATTGCQSFDEYADAFRHHFQRAVKRRIRSANPVAVAVSGGLDSSAIFCTATVRAETSIVGLTYTTRDGGPSDESAYVAEVERACGRTIRYVDTPAEGLLFQSAEMVHAAEAPMLNGQWFRGDRLMRAVTASGATTLLTGHWADQMLFDQAYLVDLLRTGRWGTIHTHLNEYLRWFPDAQGNEFRTQFGSDVLEHACPPWVRGCVRAVKSVWNQPAPWDDWYCDSLLREARPDVFPHDEGATALASALYREVRSQYHHLCREWSAKVATHYGVEAAFPFLDRDLVEFLIGVPATVLVRGGVPKALFRESLRGTMPEAILRRRTKGDFTEGVNHVTRRDFAAVARMLGPDSLAVQLGYVDADKLKKGLAAAGAALERSTTSVISWRVTSIAALEIWLRQFIGHQDISPEGDIAWRKTSLVNAP